MLWSVNKLSGFRLRAADGDLGKPKDCFFDDFHWTIRYLVADTGTWLSHRKVLVAPSAFAGINEAEQSLQLSISRKQVEDSPPIEADLPVSSRREQEYFQHFGWIWFGPPGAGEISYAPLMVPAAPEPAASERQGDPHLRSCREVAGYRIHTLDTHIGHVSDFLAEDGRWTIQYLVVDTGNWWPGKKVLVLPGWIERVSWKATEVRLKVTARTIQEAPEFDSSVPFTKEYEERLARTYFGKSA